MTLAILHYRQNLPTAMSEGSHTFFIPLFAHDPCGHHFKRQAQSIKIMALILMSRFTVPICMHNSFTTGWCHTHKFTVNQTQVPIFFFYEDPPMTRAPETHFYQGVCARWDAKPSGTVTKGSRLINNLFPARPLGWMDASIKHA